MPGGSARTCLCSLLGAGLLLAAAPSARGQAVRPLDEWLPRLRAGMWIKVEGRLDAAGGLRAREIKVLHGERDESEITTTVTSIDPQQRAFATAVGIRVETNSRTEVEGSKKTRSSFSALRVGDRVEAEGQLQKNHALLADEVEIKKRHEDPERDEEDEMTGRIESVSVGSRMVELLGTSVFFDEKTKNKSQFPE